MAKYANGKYTVKHPEKYVGKRAPTYRSSWEFTAFTFCDNNPSILQWASESITIPYRNPVTGKNTVYVPDLLWVYIDRDQKQHVELVEIKPASQTTMEAAKSVKDKLSVAINLCKWAAARAFCQQHGMVFRIITEYDLYRNVKR